MARKAPARIPAYGTPKELREALIKAGYTSAGPYTLTKEGYATIYLSGRITNPKHPHVGKHTWGYR